MTDTTEARHPIRVVAQRTGLTSATIRAWERRYDAVGPRRSSGGQRLYTDEDVAHLRTLKALTDGGRSISSVAGLSPDDAEALLTEDISASARQPTMVVGVSAEHRVDEAYDRVCAMDGAGLDRVLWRALVTHGASALLSEIVGPLLRRIGEGWESGEITPGHEHLASEVVEKILDRVVERLRPTNGPTMVVSTLPGERHGLGARLASSAAALDGWNVVYMGTDLPVEDVVVAAETLNARAVAISVVRGTDVAASADALMRLRTLLDPRTRLFVGGGGLEEIPDDLMPAGVIEIVGLQGFAAYRSELQA